MPQNPTKSLIATRSNSRLLILFLRMTLFAVLLALLPAAAIATPVSEYQVKAAFLYNFARFVDWPPQAHRPGNLTLCIVGANPFGSAINVIVGKPIGSDRLSVRQANADNLGDCQLVYIAGSNTATLDRVLASAKGRPIITVGDSKGFADGGAVFNFYSENNKIRFEINIDAARRTGLSISSQLLRLGRITRDRGRNSG